MLRRIALTPGRPLPRSPGPLGRIIVRQWRDEVMTVERSVAALRFVLAGEERCEIDGRIYRVAAGQMMLVPAGPPMRVAATSPGTGLSIELPEGERGELPGTLLLPLTSHPIGGWLNGLAAMLGGDEAAARPAAMAALRGIHAELAALVDACSARMAGFDAAKAATRLDLLARVEAARHHLGANLHRAVPLWELAEHARLSPFHLSRAFRDSTGQSPATYHRTRRMEAARAGLEAGERPSRVARALGFADQAGFARAFAKVHGVPPGKYALLAAEGSRPKPAAGPIRAADGIDCR